jgi:formylglycine-generating enzyme required for sulfatase activity
MRTKQTLVYGLIAVVLSLTFSVCKEDANSNTGSSLIEMVRINGGTFTMGSPTTEADRNSDETQWQVTLSGFYIGKYEVTQKQYETVMQSLPSSQHDDNYGKGDNYPVYSVRWYDALVFCNKLSMLEGLTPAYSINGKTNPDEW